MLIRRRYIDNNAGGQIHVAESGRGPSVLLIHQTPRSWDEFKEVMGLLASDLHLIAMDLPGMGASTGLERRPTIEKYAHAAAQVIDAYSANPMTICGHHTGGVVAIELAVTRPELVSSLVLSSTPWIDEEARIERARKTPIDTIERSRDGYHLIDLWRQRAPYYPDKVKYLDRFVADALKSADPAKGHAAVGRYRMEKAVKNIDCPVLLVEHMKDPFAVEHTANLKAAFPSASIEHIPNGQVALEVTAPEFSEILLGWVQREQKLPSRRTLKVVK